ncbi:MAG: FlgD immunoglobulin-like domain containing protein [bacterium]
MLRFTAISLFIMLAIGVSLPQPAYANVFASQLSVTDALDGSAGGTLQYLLNEPADNGVEIRIIRSSDGTAVRTLSGPTVQGMNTVVWDGKNDSGQTVLNGAYTFEVVASDNGHTAWERINPTDPQNVFHRPRGVLIQKDQTSPNFGRIYIIQGRRNSVNRTKVIESLNVFKGIYFMSPDGKWWGGSLDTAYPELNMSFVFASNDDSPIGLNFGPDGRIYTCTFVDRTMWNTIANPDFTDEGFQVFLHVDHSTPKDSGDIQPRKSPVTHGMISDMLIMGTGADRVIYTIDHSYPDVVPGSIMRYRVPDDAQMPWTTPPEVFLNPDEDFDPPVAAAPFSMVADAEGNIYTTTTVGDIYGFRPDGTQFLYSAWEDIVDRPSLDLDEGRRWFATTGNGIFGLVYILSMDDGSTLDMFEAGDDPIRDAQFDAAGNIVISRGADNAFGEMIIYSPPEGSNSFTTRYSKTFQIGGPVGVDNWDVH